MSSDDPDFSPFMNLNRDVELAILKQLEFREYLNLALTCRKWYNIASTAPRSFKPILKLDRLVVSIDRFDAELKIDNGKAYDEYKEFPLSINNKFELVNLIQCDTLLIDHGFIRKDFDPAVEYLVKNSDHFHFDRLEWDVQQKGSLNEQLLAHIFNLPTDLQVGRSDGSEVIDSTKLECIRKVIEENKTLENIGSFMRMPISVVKTLLKQVINGDRPKLRNFNFMFERVFVFDVEVEDEDDVEYNDESLIKDFIQLEFLDNLKSEKRIDGVIKFVLITSDSREMTIVHECSIAHVYVYFDNDSKYFHVV